MFNPSLSSSERVPSTKLRLLHTAVLLWSAVYVKCCSKLADVECLHAHKEVRAGTCRLSNAAARGCPACRSSLPLSLLCSLRTTKVCDMVNVCTWGMKFCVCLNVCSTKNIHTFSCRTNISISSFNRPLNMREICRCCT